MYNRYYNESSDEGTLSKFNGGILQTQRVHELQLRLNRAKVNLLSFNLEENVYNYEAVISYLNSLYQEVRPKLGDKEKIMGDTFVEKAEEFIIKFPVHEDKISQNAKSKKIVVFSQINWLSFRKLLFKWEALIRIFLDKHELNSATKEDDTGL